MFVVVKTTPCWLYWPQLSWLLRYLVQCIMGISFIFSFDPKSQIAMVLMETYYEQDIDLAVLYGNVLYEQDIDLAVLYGNVL